jgi:hypothetical protein
MLLGWAFRRREIREDGISFLEWRLPVAPFKLHRKHNSNAVARKGLELGLVAEQRDARRSGGHEEIKLEV